MTKSLFALIGVLTLSLSAADTRVYISGYDNTVTCLALNEATGELAELSKSDGGKNPTYMAFHPNRKFVYSVNEVGGGTVTAFSIDPKDGKLTKLNDASSGGNGPCHVAVHPGGKWLFAGNYGSGHVGITPIKDDGSLGESLPGVHGGKNAHQVVVDPTGKFVHVPFLGSNCVNHYSFDEATGKLTPCDPPTAAATQLKAGPRHLVLHPNLKFGYVINELNCTMDRFDYDKTKGTMSAPTTLPTQPEGTDMKGKSTAHVVISPDGKFLYGSNRGHNSIVIYSIDQTTGALKLVGHETAEGEVKVPRDFALDASGKYCIVASQGSDYITVFTRDAEKGTLKKIGKYTVAPKPAFVGFVKP